LEEKNNNEKTMWPKVSVIVCTLNEAGNLPSLLPRIPSWVHEVLLVDGHSTDGTVQVAKKFRPDTRIVYQPNKGKGDALKFGVRLSSGQVIVILDADGTYPPEEMKQFVKAVWEGKELAKGTRLKSGKPSSMPWQRWFGNKVLTLTTNLLFGTKYTDICSGYNAFSKEAFHKLDLESDGFEMEQELIVKAKLLGLKVQEIPHSYASRIYGKSKTRDFYQGFKNMLWIVSLRFRF
jgi:glycosyltransferase involved in cell wall biosynthesis